MSEPTQLKSAAKQIAIITLDAGLTAATCSVLGSEFMILTGSDLAHAHKLISENLLEAMLIDISSRFLYEDEPQLILDESLANGLPVIVLASDSKRQEALELVRRGAHSHVDTSQVSGNLGTALLNACGQHEGELKTAAVPCENIKGLDQLIGASVQMQLLYKQIRQVANINAYVLVTGESGTGKELIARAIHTVGGRSTRPFVAVSCGAIPETLIEAELFGHEKGAFTGTTGVREGYLENAGDGTLLLDEIGELSLQTQVKLLRVLQQREFTRLGSNRAIPLRARIVFATHRDLGQMVAEGKFRQDLFYRINVMNIQAPALRSHPEDIPLIAGRLLEKYSDLYRKPIEGISSGAMDRLRGYAWPGNVRELENVLQRAIILSEGYAIEPADLPGAFHESPAQEFVDEFGQEFDNDRPSGSFERQVHAYKIKLATEAIQYCRGNKTQAAENLAISRAYLHRLIRHSPVPTHSWDHRNMPLQIARKSEPKYPSVRKLAVGM